MTVEWNRLKAAELNALAAKDAIVILPVASTEQHGPHLPTGVDVFQCAAVCRMAAERATAAGVPVVVTPTLWCGLAEHHVEHGGSFTLSLATYQAVLTELTRSIVRAGFSRIVIVNGHGGNISALNAMQVDLTKAVGVPIAVTTYFALCEPEFGAVLEDQKGVQHACEAETSMMMVLEPDLVDRSKLSGAHGLTNEPGSVLAKPLMIWRSFKTISPSGVIGDARKASPEKGRQLVDIAAKGLADRLIVGEPWTS